MSTGLAGADESATTASASIDIPPGASLLTAHASWMISAPLTATLSRLPELDGEVPERLEVVAGLDGSSKVYAITASGERKELENGLPWHAWISPPPAG